MHFEQQTCIYDKRNIKEIAYWSLALLQYNLLEL